MDRYLLSIAPEQIHALLHLSLPPVHFFSLEMPPPALVHRQIISISISFA
jgi:hypothetical protein